MDASAIWARPADAGLAHLVRRAVLVQRPFQGPELVVGGGRLLDLGLDQVRPLAPEAVQLDQEAADVPELKLAELAQETGSAARVGTLAGRGGSVLRWRAEPLGRRGAAALDDLLEQPTHGACVLNRDEYRPGPAGSLRSPSMDLTPDRPIAVFDSGVGGLTVLHELLVSLPGEDYIYLGDTARFPYGERSAEELQGFAVQIADRLLQEGAKLLVVACNALSSAALGALEAHVASTGREVDVIGVVAPATQLAVAGSHSGRIGLLATPATVASQAYERAVRAADPHVHLESVPCPDLAPIIQSGFPFSQQVVETVRSYCEPLRQSAVDTVILGCTHYPLVAPLLQRMLGRGVTLVTSGTGVTRSVERALDARGLLNSRPEEGSYRFYCTGDAEVFEELGSRFLQMPLHHVSEVSLAEEAPV